jgi:hypothetical protein
MLRPALYAPGKPELPDDHSPAATGGVHGDKVAYERRAPLGTPETYTVRTDMPPEVSVTVDPSSLTFSNPGEMHFYQITVSTNIFPVQRGRHRRMVLEQA